MHDSSHSPMTAAEAASLREASPVDAALLQRIRAALVARNAESDTRSSSDAEASAKDVTDSATQPAADTAAVAEAEAVAAGGTDTDADAEANTDAATGVDAEPSLDS